MVFSLKDINLELRFGEVTSVVGENGNGKTTFFRTVVGEIPHDNGTIAFPIFDGGEENNINWGKVNQHIAYVPQNLPPFDGKVKKVLQFEAAIHGFLGKENDLEVNFIIQRLGLQDYEDSVWNKLSGGYKLRFALARALVWKPKLLVIDEPLANLDIKAQLVVLRDIRRLANSLRYPMSVLLSSQHLHEIEAVSDKILFLKNGNVSFYGDQKEIGSSRKYNTFEFRCNFTITELKTLLMGLDYKTLNYNGISFVITTPLKIGSKKILKYFIERDIEIEYFRNISHSIKQLFNL